MYDGAIKGKRNDVFGGEGVMGRRVAICLACGAMFGVLMCPCRASQARGDQDGAAQEAQSGIQGAGRMSASELEQLKAAGWGDKYEGLADPGVAPQPVDLASFSASHTFITRTGRLRIVTHPMKPSQMVAPPESRITFTVWGAPCLRGKGPLTIWRDGKFVMAWLNSGPWVVADMGGEESPYVFGMTWFLDIGSLEIVDGDLNNPDAGRGVVGSITLAQGDYRFIPRPNSGRKEPDCLLQRRVVTELPELPPDVQWEDAGVWLEYDFSLGRYKLEEHNASGARVTPDRLVNVPPAKTGYEALDEAGELPFTFAVVRRCTSSDGSPGVKVDFTDSQGEPLVYEMPYPWRDFPKRVDRDVLLLSRVRDLRAVFLGMRPYSEEAIAVLGDLTGLEFLSLWLGATDGDMRHVGKLVNLRRLDLENTDVTDAGIEALVGLRNLKSLNLEHTDVTNAGIEALAGLRSLQELDLVGTKVTGDCLRHIAQMDGLQRLNLSGVPVTDEQLMLLSRLPKLKRLYLDLTEASEDGIKKLLATSPSLELVSKDTSYYRPNPRRPERSNKESSNSNQR